MERNSDFTSRFNEMLNKLGITQQIVADRTQLNKGIISRYVKGKAKPKAETLNLIAKTFYINPLWLMGYDTTMRTIYLTPDGYPYNYEKLNEINRLLSEEQREKVIEMIYVMYPEVQ